MEEIVTSLKSILELGAPAVYLVFLAVLWRQYLRTIDLLVQVLNKYCPPPDEKSP